MHKKGHKTCTKLISISLLFNYVSLKLEWVNNKMLDKQSSTQSKAKQIKLK